MHEDLSEKKKNQEIFLAKNKTKLFKSGPNLLHSFIYLTHFTHTHTQHHHHQFRKLSCRTFFLIKSLESGLSLIIKLLFSC